MNEGSPFKTPDGQADEIMDANQVAEMLHVTYAWVIKHSNPKRRWHIPNFKIGKFRRYRRSAVIEAIIELEKNHGLSN